MDTAVSRRTFLALAAGAVGSRAAMAQTASPAGADVVIVGGDPAALAAAYRLSRTAGVRVVLVDDRPAWQPASVAPASIAELPAFARGHRVCFDGWRDAGNPGWSYDDVLPAFRGLERYEGGASATRGGTGPVAVAHCWDPHALHRAFLVAAVSAGYQQDARHDFNGPRSQGVAGYYQKAQVDDRPQTFVEALLDPAVSAGVTVVRGVVGRLLTERGRVRGVQVESDGARHEIRADVAVLVAAAPVRAAQVLQLSGIGPADVLRRAGIAVVADRPGVGRNLHVHVRVPVRWQARGTALALPASTVSAGMFTVSLRASPPDLQLDFVDPAAAGGPLIGVDVTLVQPASRGEVRVRSSDPHDPPATVSGMLTGAADVSALVQGVRLARLIVGGAPLDAGRGDEHGDTRAVTSQAGLEALVRTTARSTADAAGTCAMGAADDPMAVVDNRLAVHGVTGLHVAGAAVMPAIVNAPPAAASLMLGDRAAGFLRNGRA
jgi:choline dehydrogenase